MLQILLNLGNVNTLISSVNPEAQSCYNTTTFISQHLLACSALRLGHVTRPIKLVNLKVGLC